MILTFFILYTVAAIVYINNREKDWGKWLSLLLFSFGSGAFGKSLVESFFPYLVKYNFVTLDHEFLFQITYSLGSFFNQNVSPYGFMMFAATYSGLFSKEKLRLLGSLLLIPLFIMFFNTTFYPQVSHNWILVAVWAIPCFLIGTFFMIYSTKVEKNNEKKKDRKLFNYLLLPPFLTNVLTNYVGHAVGLTAMWRLNAIPVAIAGITCFVMMTKMGVLGVRLKIEKQAFDNKMQVFNSGSGLLNHAVKNQIYKINSSLFLLRPYRDQLNASGKEAIDIISRSSDHLTNMVDRIQSKTKEIHIVRSKQNFNKMIDDSIEDIQMDCETKRVKIIKNYNAGNIDVICDSAHTKEVFLNILNNALEVLKEGGEIEVLTDFGKSDNVIVVFTDNGLGISQNNLRRVVDPFFTTKGKSGTNFGLGLAYCYHVMTKSGGNLEIESELNKGTSVKLTFPIKEV
ncbi:sensor histidine kinase [Peribacillus aracenensis]|uniref:sensor histidine kinase n=1 Tax=Peribacillus aracenensis TaxID=2976708 RepID=UPI0021A6379A|nr:HAMP domain-containing sensor histidine kinase [Peribacillus sp. BBB004]